MILHCDNASRNCYQQCGVNLQGNGLLDVRKPNSVGPLHWRHVSGISFNENSHLKKHTFNHAGKRRSCEGENTWAHLCNQNLPVLEPQPFEEFGYKDKELPNSYETFLRVYEPVPLTAHKQLHTVHGFCPCVQHDDFSNQIASRCDTSLQTKRRSMYRCAGCNETFAKLIKLKVHLLRCHSGATPFRCLRVNCHAAFANKGTLRKHVSAAHSEVVPYKCKHCLSRFSSSIHLMKHIRRNHPHTIQRAGGASRAAPKQTSVSLKQEEEKKLNTGKNNAECEEGCEKSTHSICLPNQSEDLHHATHCIKQNLHSQDDTVSNVPYEKQFPERKVISCDKYPYQELKPFRKKRRMQKKFTSDAFGGNQSSYSCKPWNVPLQQQDMCFKHFNKLDIDMPDDICKKSVLLQKDGDDIRCKESAIHEHKQNTFRCKEPTDFVTRSRRGHNTTSPGTETALKCPFDFQCGLGPIILSSVQDNRRIPYRCQICSTEFFLCSQLLSHIRRLHAIQRCDKLKANISEDKKFCQPKNTTSRHSMWDAPYRCEHCKIQYKQRKMYLRHVKCVHGTDSLLNRSTSETSLQKRSRVRNTTDNSQNDKSVLCHCVQCILQSRRNNALPKHNSRVHRSYSRDLRKNKEKANAGNQIHKNKQANISKRVNDKNKREKSLSLKDCVDGSSFDINKSLLANACNEQTCPYVRNTNGKSGLCNDLSRKTKRKNTMVTSWKPAIPNLETRMQNDLNGLGKLTSFYGTTKDGKVPSMDDSRRLQSDMESSQLDSWKAATARFVNVYSSRQDMHCKIKSMRCCKPPKFASPVQRTALQSGGLKPLKVENCTSENQAIIKSLTSLPQSINFIHKNCRRRSNCPKSSAESQLPAKDSSELRLAKKVLYQCEYCNTKFRQMAELIKHVVRVHNRITVTYSDLSKSIVEECSPGEENCKCHVSLSLSKQNNAESKWRQLAAKLTKNNRDLNKPDNNCCDQYKSLSEKIDAAEDIDYIKKVLYRCERCNAKFNQLGALLKHRVIHASCRP